MALTLARPVTSSSASLSTHTLLLHRRLISFTSITQPPSVPSLILGRQSQAPLSHAVGSVAATGFTAIRCEVRPTVHSDSNIKKAPKNQRLQKVKLNSRKSYSEIAEQTGLTNVYVAQLLRGQAELKPDTADKLKAALPELSDDLLNEMAMPQVTYVDPDLDQEPTVYRLRQAVTNFGESIKEIIKEIINKEFDRMPEIDSCSVDKVKGVDGKDRVAVTFMLPLDEICTTGDCI